MRLRYFLSAVSFGLVVSCSSDTLLDLDPTDSVPEDQAIVDAQTARAALAGAYNATQDPDEGYYYAETFLDWGDLSSDNTEAVGTFTGYFNADDNALVAGDVEVEGLWDNIYEAVNRANVLIARLPSVPGLDADERDNMLGQSLFLRALHYHNLMKLWAGPIPGDANADGVPLRLEPVTDLASASQIQRASRTEVYTQILADLLQAATLLAGTTDTRAASFGAVKALEARVHLYRADYANALAAANAVEALGYTLAADYADLFTADGSDTPEDIFRIVYTPAERNFLGRYYLSDELGGRYEIAPTQDLFDAYEANDVRRDVTIGATSGGDLFGFKFPTVVGAEHPHVIRFAEIILTKAEALARTNPNLALAVAEYNRVRQRAGLTPHVFGVQVTNQQQVLDAIWNERRLELALEGDRFPELVRTGTFVATMGAAATASRYPIPQNERDVTSPALAQNPGY
jgi:hypothetical protein